MQKLAVTYYPPIATNDFVIFSDTVSLPAVVHDKDDRSTRKKNIRSHIKSDDYFGTLATVIDFIAQEKEEMEERQNKILKNLKNDLVYLQKNYKIIKKK